MYIEVNKAGLTYRKHGKDFIALSDTSISIAKGEFICRAAARPRFST